MITHHHINALLLTIALVPLLHGCDNAQAPEQRVRALIAAAEQAAEQKDIGTLRGYVSGRYADDEGRDRRAIDAVLRLYLLRHEKIHLLTRIADIRLAPPGRAEAVIYVAMAARPVTQAEDLAALRANLYRFEIGLVEEGTQWRVVRANWRPAELADFVYQPGDAQR